MTEAQKVIIATKLVESARGIDSLNNKLTDLLNPNNESDGFNVLGDIIDPLVYVLGFMAADVPKEKRTSEFLADPGRAVYDLTVKSRIMAEEAARRIVIGS